jgi:hypothetical protein
MVANGGAEVRTGSCGATETGSGLVAGTGSGSADATISMDDVGQGVARLVDGAGGGATQLRSPAGRR